MILKRFFTQTAVLVVALTLALGVNYLYAWTGPAGTAPACVSGNVGCDAPLNLSANPQSKTGSLSVGTYAASTSLPSFIAYGTQSVSGWMSVGTQYAATKAPTQLLDLVGRPGVDGIKFPDGTVQTSASGVVVIPRYTMKMDTSTLSHSNPSQFVGGSVKTGSYLSTGNITFGIGTDQTAMYSTLFEMKLNAPSATTLTQFLGYVDDDAYFYLNGSLVTSVSTWGTKSQTITWNLVRGINTIDIILNNSQRGPVGMNLMGDFFLQNPSLQYVP